jgi:hypothetical protein
VILNQLYDTRTEEKYLWKNRGRGVKYRRLKKAYFNERNSKLRLFGFRSIAGMASIRGKDGPKRDWIKNIFFV